MLNTKTLSSAPIRSSVQAIVAAINVKARQDSAQRTKLDHILSVRGGPWKTNGKDSVFFQVYKASKFFGVSIEAPEITTKLLVHSPPGPARDNNARARLDYWQRGKHLSGGNLVALVVVENDVPRIFLGVIHVFDDDVAKSSKHNPGTVVVPISFIDAEVELMAFRGKPLNGENSYALLVDNGVMYESARPFLERLKTIEPTDVPFARYITAGDSLVDVEVRPPTYALSPTFRFNLACLAPDKAAAKRIHELDIRQPHALARARQELVEHTTLDPSQVEAMMATFTREVSLGQG